MFIDFVDNTWIRERSVEYFQKRDPKALDYLPKLLPPVKQEDIPPPPPLLSNLSTPNKNLKHVADPKPPPLPPDD